MDEEPISYPIRHRVPLWISLPFMVMMLAAAAAFWGLRHELGWLAYVVATFFAAGALLITIRAETTVKAARRQAWQRHFVLGWVPVGRNVFRAEDLEAVRLGTAWRRDGSLPRRRPMTWMTPFWTVSLRHRNGRQYAVKSFFIRGKLGPPQQAETLYRQLARELGLKGELRYESP